MTSGIPSSILLDTNVWLDQYLSTRPGHEESRRLLDVMLSRGIAPLYAAHSSKDVYCLIKTAIKRLVRTQYGGPLTQENALAADEIAWSCLENMIELGTAVGCDQADIWIADKQRAIHSDYEDNLIAAAAMRSTAMLVTNDASLLAHCPVGALGVHDALTWLKAMDTSV